MHLPLSTVVKDARRSADRPRVWQRRPPARRVAATALVALPLGWVLADAGGGWALADLPVWSVLVIATALLGAVTLSTYVPAPGTGWRPDLRCAPCSAVSGLTVLAAVWIVGLGPHQASMAAVAVLVTAAGLLQRLSADATACSADARSRGTAAGRTSTRRRWPR